MQIIMAKRRNIRNICIISNTTQEKEMLTDLLLSKYCIVVYDPDEDTLESTGLDICKRCITIEPAIHSIFFRMNERDLRAITHSDQKEQTDDGFLVNFVELDPNELIATIRMSDGTIVVVDCTTGSSEEHIEISLKEAIKQSIKPVLFLDKLDSALFELHLDAEDLYQALNRDVENVNNIIATHYSQSLDETRVDPSKGSVAFGSAAQGWAFTLKQFSEIYALKFNIDPNKLASRLWGENFFNAKTKKWTKKSDDADTKRSFCTYILDPIYKVYDAIMSFNQEETDAVLKKIGVTIPERDLTSKKGKELFVVVMRSWLPAGEALLQMIAIHLPSPVVAQKYRMEMLYEGPHDDEAAIGVKMCSPSSPLVLYVGRVVKGYACARVLSGRVAPAEHAHVVRTNQHHIEKVCNVKIKGGAFLMMGRYVETVENVPAGNICGLGGIEKFLTACHTQSGHIKRLIQK